MNSSSAQFNDRAQCAQGVFCGTLVLLKFYVNLWLQAIYNFGSAVRPVVSNSNGTKRKPLPGLRLLQGYCKYYVIHGSLYTCTSAHVLITLCVYAQQVNIMSLAPPHGDPWVK